MWNYILRLIFVFGLVHGQEYPGPSIKESCLSQTYCPEADTSKFWKNEAQITLFEHLANNPYKNVAKNVILFLGDGMSVATIVAARAYKGQINNQSGEHLSLSFEKFPYTGLSKTYCVDRQVADSACSATAYLCGVKANSGTIGVTANVLRRDCTLMNDAENQATSIAQWSQLKGKATGIVTTTRVTHASPAGVYAHVSSRSWEYDGKVTRSNCDTNETHDIAYQLINGDTGKNLNVILGGGRQMFLPRGNQDVRMGLRKDNTNLIEKWIEYKTQFGVSQYVSNRNELLSVTDAQNLLGLFSNSHMSFNLDRDPETEPSLAEMTEAAINVLSKNTSGYFLFVEGGMIDQAHHGTMAHKALDETLMFAEAVQKAVDMTNREDTLIVVTADHSHTMTLNGYAGRGDNIFGLGGLGEDGLPYSILTYASGPSQSYDEDGTRHDLNNDEMDDTNYMFPAQIPLKQETHGGEDVPVYAVGPWAHLFTGVYEQNVIPHLMAYASCVGEGMTACNDTKTQDSKLP